MAKALSKSDSPWHRWRAKNEERYLAYQKARYQRDKEKIRDRNKLISAQRVAKNRAYYQQFPERMRARQMKARYGVTLGQYMEMYDAQGGRCAICGGAESDSNRGRFNVDHCHETEKIRGLLCGRCNRTLGQARDSVKILLAAARYLIERR